MARAESAPLLAPVSAEPFAVAAAVLVLHLATNGQYGFHRDELATLDDGRHLAWGFVAYPPVTPFFAWLGSSLFGASPAGLRIWSSLAQAVAIVFSGLLAREIGGGDRAQTITSAAVAVAPVSLAAGALLQYVSFDYLWWTLTAWSVARLLRTEDPRWWVASGLVAGLGAETKYTIAFLGVAVIAGFAGTPARRYLLSGWFGAGLAVAVAVASPNLVWQALHGFVTLEFLKDIHARDVRIGRTSGFFRDQLLIAANPVTIPLWLAGLAFLLRAREMVRFRSLAWMFLLPLALFAAAQGRGYYLAPAYPMLLAGGAVFAERWIVSRSALTSVVAVLALGGVVVVPFTLPVATVGSPLWKMAIGINQDFSEELGWPELVASVAQIRDEVVHAGSSDPAILAGNYGEAGAIDLYGPSYGLPAAISGVNSFWERGYGNPPPATVILVGLSRRFAEHNFESCRLAGHAGNRSGVQNEETRDHSDIFVCGRIRSSWPEFWKGFRYYG